MTKELKEALKTFLSKDDFEIIDNVLNMVNDVCEKEIEPYSREMDQFGTKWENGKIILHPQNAKIVETFRKNDLFGLTIPEKYNGSGLNTTMGYAVSERINQADSSLRYMGLQSTIVDFIEYSNSDVLKEKYYPDLSKGKRFGGLLLTEPQSGSDLGSVKSRATRDGDHYIVNGQKIFITNCHVADTLVFLASTDPSKGRKGLTAFVLDTKDQPGYQVTGIEHKLGVHACPTGSVSLDKVEIPIENRIGEEGSGFSTVLNVLTASRIGVAAGATGVAQAAYLKSLLYAHERYQFRQSVLQFQSNKFKIADMATKIHLARNSYLYAAQLKDQKRDFSTAASIAKLYASEMAQQVTYDAIQLHGGYGFIQDYDVERYYRDVRITTLFEGTSEIQREIISRNEIKRYTNN